MLGTTRFLTDDTGSEIDAAVYTAFGERTTGTAGRFGYIGAWGYQAHDETPYLHVGARYYDPASGRFLQRDPIGIEGEGNTYAYVGNAATLAIDPSGLRRGDPPKKRPPRRYCGNCSRWPQHRKYYPDDPAHRPPTPRKQLSGYEYMKWQQRREQENAVLCGIGIGLLGFAGAVPAIVAFLADTAAAIYSQWGD